MTQEMKNSPGTQTREKQRRPPLPGPWRASITGERGACLPAAADLLVSGLLWRPHHCSRAAGVACGGGLFAQGRRCFGLSKNSAPSSGTSSAEGDFVWSSRLPRGLGPLMGAQGSGSFILGTHTACSQSSHLSLIDLAWGELPPSSCGASLPSRLWGECDAGPWAVDSSPTRMHGDRRVVRHSL